MKYTFENILEKVVNNRTLSRKDKQVAINQFLKEHTGKVKPTLPEELAIIDTLKNLKKSYSLKDIAEK